MLGEVLCRRLEDVELQLLFRAEVSEQAALGDAKVVGEISDGHPFQAADARELQSVCDDPLTRRLAADGGAGHRGAAPAGQRNQGRVG
mgnify:CR=1 FL=1